MINQYQPTTVTHPGEELRERLDELGIKPMEFAVRCSKPLKTISEVLNGKSSITPDMAVLFESVLKTPARYWLKRQSLHDEAKARAIQQKYIEAAKEWARAFPYPKMAQKGWVVTTSKVEEKVVALFNFFSITSHTAWEKYYLHKEVKGAFRVSLAHAKSPYALSAWLRQGDIEAQQIEGPSYNHKKLKAILPSLQKLMKEQPSDFFQQIQNHCLKTGLKVVYTPCLPKAPVNGVARWIEGNNTPLIQLSCRYKRNDSFWFSFFHEIGHILLHGKTDVFLENIDYDDADMEKEDEADEFAIKWTLSKKAEQHIINSLPLSDEDLIQFAKEYNTHPALIVGRLQRLEYLTYAQFNHHKVAIDLGTTA